MRRALLITATLAMALAACTSGTGDGRSSNPGKPVTFEAPAARSGSETVRLEGVEYGSGNFGVVFAHERPGSQDGWTEIARQAAAKGLRVLTFNFRGYGVSGGSRSDLGLIDLDVAAAVGYLKSQGAQKVVLVGGSMGGTASLVAATRTEVAAVVAVSAPATFMGLDATASVPKLKVPVLYIAAADDKPAADDARKLTALRGDQVREIVTGGGHASELVRGTDGAHLRSRIVSFIEETLVKQSGA